MTLRTANEYPEGRAFAREPSALAPARMDTGGGRSARRFRVSQAQMHPERRREIGLDRRPGL